VAWLPVVLWAALIFVLSSIPGTSLPTVEVPQADKMVHTLIYGILGALVLRGLRQAPNVRTVLLAAALATLYGISDEIHQLWTPHRSADWRDVVADAVGGLLGTLALIGGRWMKMRACFMMKASKD
jgi:VanZ family protein